LQVTELLTADRKVKRGRSHYVSPPLSGFRGGAWVPTFPEVVLCNSLSETLTRNTLIYASVKYNILYL
jgi:hypothetical protein